MSGWIQAAMQQNTNVLLIMIWYSQPRGNIFLENTARKEKHQIKLFSFYLIGCFSSKFEQISELDNSRQSYDRKFLGLKLIWNSSRMLIFLLPSASMTKF